MNFSVLKVFDFSGINKIMYKKKKKKNPKFQYLDIDQDSFWLYTLFSSQNSSC